MYDYNDRSGLSRRHSDEATSLTRKPPKMMVDISNKKIVMGFWHNWSEGQYSGGGYKQGFFANLSLTDIPVEYNVIAVSFMKVSGGAAGDHLPDFKPTTMSEQEFIRQVGVLHAEGRVVLISLGGADAHIELQSSDEDALVGRIIELTERYGFDGLDIDLEQAAIAAADNQKVIPCALKRVKNYYRQQGKHFIISMAPEFPHLRIGGTYPSYITQLEGYYDFIAPQFYNQGGDGIYAAGVGYMTQNNDAKKEDFLYYLTESIVTGKGEYVQIPHDKFVIGLPSNDDAAANGYASDPQAVINALNRLDAAGIPIRGLMTWSVNWDAGTTKDRVPYNWQFITRYGFLSEGTTPTPPQTAPSVPANLTASNITTTSVTLRWQASTGSAAITAYTLYRDGVAVASSPALTFTDSGLQPASTVQYQVSAADSMGKTSAKSPAISVTLQDASNPVSGWQESKWYVDGDRVSYQSTTYVCVMQHTSTFYWTPNLATTLWQRA